LNISQEGLALIKKFEGCKLKAYQDSVDVWTIGYGHTKGVEEGQEITQDEAEEMLASELEEYEGYISDMVECDLEQCQFDALVAWVYNLGPTNLKSSTLLKRLNWFSGGGSESDFEDVPEQIKRWNKAGGKVLQGLVRRREAEALLFQGKEWHEI
jgi:lysozyme|tara:strand:+ start:239 stop:703 length:465 start_codon:yes stop_codon:yes gene_type:complete